MVVMRFVPKFTLLLSILLLICSSEVQAQNIDIRILRDVNLNRNQSLDGVMTGLTNSVYPMSGIVPIFELVAGYKKRDRAMVKYGWRAVEGLGVNALLTFGMKYAINRPRPYNTYPDIQNYQNDKDPSFPSGHTSFAFCTATNISRFYPRWYVVVPAYTWAAAVGYSRMDLGMHYPSDVLVGAIVGTGSAWLAVLGNRYLQNRKYKRDFIQ